MKLSADFFTGNRRRLLDTLKEEEMVVLCSGWPVHQTGDADYPFHIDHNFYYMAGLVEGEITLALYKDKNGETHQALFIRKPDPLKEKWVGRVLRPQEAVEQSGVEAVFYLEQWESQDPKGQPLIPLWHRGPEVPFSTTLATINKLVRRT